MTKPENFQKQVAALRQAIIEQHRTINGGEPFMETAFNGRQFIVSITGPLLAVYEYQPPANADEESKIISWWSVNIFGDLMDHQVSQGGSLLGEDELYLLFASLAA